MRPDRCPAPHFVRPIGTPAAKLDQHRPSPASFAGDLGLRLTTPAEAKHHPVALLCRRVVSRRALQAILWDAKLMLDFVAALSSSGVILVLTALDSERVAGWFGEHVISAWLVDDLCLFHDERAVLLLSRPAAGAPLHGNLLSALSSTGKFSPATSLSADPVHHRELLRCLARADFVSSYNEDSTSDDHYFSKIRSWFAESHSAVVDRSTGIEYFAQFRVEAGLWMLLSIGVQSASDKGRVTLHDFLYDRANLNAACLHDRIGFADKDGLAELRAFLDDAVRLLAGPSMALVHDVYFDSVGHFQYAKVELCRAQTVEGPVEETGDLSFIAREPAGFSITSSCNERVAAEAMRVVFYDKHEENISRLFKDECVPIAVYLEYDIAKAVRVVPHSRAVMRRRYAGILAQKKLMVPTLEYALHPDVEKTALIHAVDAEGHVLLHSWGIVMGLLGVSMAGAAAVAYAVSLDGRVNAAEVLATGLAILTGLLLSLPTIYVNLVGGGYTLGDFYRGCAPTAWMMRRHGVGFLRECVAKGVKVEGVVSGRNACFLMGQARGGLDIGPVRVRDLDERWDYGVNAKGVLCMRYKGVVGDMQAIEREKNGRMVRWWHCAVIGSEIVRVIGTQDVITLLGDGEVG